MADKNEIDWGGSAFPCEGGSDSNLYPDPGMSLRDYFAGQALSGQLANRYQDQWSYQEHAKRAFDQADAMIAARKGGAA
jgi:hypothetical protein